MGISGEIREVGRRSGGLRCRLFLSLAAVLFLAAGCSRSAAWLDRRDRSDPLMKRAQARAKEGDVKAAIRLYQTALDSNPEMARAHLDLALLYHDYEKDFVRAIYHYRRYQELRGDTEKKQMIEDRIRVAGQLFAVSVKAGDVNTPDKAVLEQENETLKNMVEQLKSELSGMRGKYERLVEAVKQQRSTGLNGGDASPRVLPGSQVVLPESVGGSGRGGGAAGRGASSNEVSRAVRTYRVQTGDTLSSIAAQVYGDKAEWTRLQKANRLGSSTSVKVGQVLVIP